jgi:Carboxypeptidase regulatory-like domain/TonB dependent receptor
VRKIVAALALISVLVIGNKVLPQSPTASITGIVFDADNKVIPNAEIIVVNDLTRVQYETKTNGEGIYTVVSLPPGPYRVQVSKTDFKTIIKPDIILNVGDALSLNFTLPVGASSVSVTVEGGAPVINTTDASVSTVVDRQFAENLPMNGRSFQTLIYLTPGVVAVPTNQADGGQFSVNGQRAASNYWMVDGVSANIGIAAGTAPGNGFGGTLGSFSALGGTNSLVSVDALQEFRIQTSTFAPEFGRTPGGQISIVTRSGANQFHGTVFDYVRNGALDANNWFANNADLPKPQEQQNDFGGTFSGPFIKDRTFFFFSYEGLRLQLPQTTLTSVPCDSSCTVAGDVRTSAVPSMQPYLNAFPLPNGPEIFLTCNPASDPTCPASGKTSSGSAAFNASYSNPASLDAYSLRVDHKISENWTLFGRYNYSPSTFLVRGTGDQSAALSDLQNITVTTQTGTAGLTWANSGMASDFRVNLSRTSSQGNEYLDGFGGAVPLSGLPFPASKTTQNSLFDLLVFGMGDGGELAVGKSGQSVQRQFNVVEGFTRQEGRHALKFGVDFRRLTPEFIPYGYGQLVGFSDVDSLTAGTTSFGEILSLSRVTFLFRNLGLYGQDTWRVSPRLTLTYGARWDFDLAPGSLEGPALPAVTGYNPNNFATLAVAPAGTAPFKTTYLNVAPRVSAAYQLSQKDGRETVLRSGFGVFYDLVSSEVGNLLAQASSSPPFGNFTVLSNAQFPFTPAESTPPPFLPATLADLVAFNPNLKLPYTLQWNVAVEQAVGKDQSISASYIGAAGRRLLQSIFVSSAVTNSNVQAATFVDNGATSSYNALQMKFQRRLSQGIQALASYTWAHSIDSGSAGSLAILSNLGVPGTAISNRGDSDFDIRNTFTAGITMDIPSPRKDRLTLAVLGGWSMQTLIIARSAPPVDVSDANFYQIDGVLADIRPDLVPGEPLYLYGAKCLALAPPCPGGKAINPAAFKDPPVDPVTGGPTRQGDLPRNFLRGFGATQWDFAVHRQFSLGEALKLQFRAEMFNVLNHPNFGPPKSQFGEAGFGLSTQTLAQSLSSGGIGAGGFNPLYQIGGPRSIQLALKLIF